MNDDAFQQDWSSAILYMNPPFSRTEELVKKIYSKEASGILIEPCRKRYVWFEALQLITVKWMEIDPPERIYESIPGELLPEKNIGRKWSTS